MVSIETLEKIGNAWTHPKTGEVRYYIDAEKVADMAGISGTAYGRGNRALSRTEFGKLLGCKFWLDSEGELHIKGCMPLTLIEGMKTAEDLIRETVAQAIAEAEPTEETETVTEWKFDDCKVSEEDFDHDLHCFVVTMERDGQIRRQTVYPRDLDDMDALRRHLIGGRSPVKSGWEDGMGNDVCWENAEEVE